MSAPTADGAVGTANPVRHDRLAGAAALTFAVVVLIQNLIRGALAPLNNADFATVAGYYASHRPVETLLSSTYVVSGVALIVFLGSVLSSLTGPARRWGGVGSVAGIGIVGTFTVVMGLDASLEAVASAGSDQAVRALWAAHNGLFAVLDLSIAVALFGLSRYTVAAEATPQFFAWLAPAGAVLLAVGAASAPVLADGLSLVPFGVAGLGFAVWLLYLAVTGIRMVR